MNFLKNVIAAGAAVGVYKLVDYGLRKLERRVLDRDVPLQDEIPNVEKDAIVVAGSRLDHIPSARERDLIARTLNLIGSALATAVALEVRDRLMDGVDEDDESHLIRHLLITTGGFIALDLLLKPALGMSEGDGRRRRFVSHLASRSVGRGVRQLMA